MRAIAPPPHLPLPEGWPRHVRSAFLSPRPRLLPCLRDRWDGYPAGTTFAGAGLFPAGSTSLYSRRTGTTTGTGKPARFSFAQL